jgi:AcrR family transcriptional regulator
MSDIDKRIGRQSAENTIKTRKDIIDAATALFCEQGYAKVSLRAISEQAGVSHGLIRHHFGTKFDVWQQVCDRIRSYFHSFASSLTAEFSAEMANNERLFLVMINLQAVLILDPRPIQLMADSMEQGAQMHDYMFDEQDEVEIFIGEMLALCHQDGVGLSLQVKELEWLLVSFAHSFSSLAPLSKSTYPTLNDTQRQLQYWHFFARILAPQLGLTEQAIPKVDSLASFVAQSPLILNFNGYFDSDS